MALSWIIKLKIFSNTFPIHFECDFTFTFSFWRNGKLWADGFNSKVAQLDETFHLIYIFKVVQGVSSASPSAIQVKVVSKKLTSDSDSEAFTTPGTIENGQKFDYQN